MFNLAVARFGFADFPPAVENRSPTLRGNRYYIICDIIDLR